MYLKQDVRLYSAVNSYRKMLHNNWDENRTENRKQCIHKDTFKSIGNRKVYNDLHAQRNSILNVLALERNKKTHSTECKGKTKTPQKTC